MKNPNFVLVKDYMQAYKGIMNEGSETRIYTSNIGDGNFIEKRYKHEDIKGIPDPENWYKRQENAKDISKYLLKKANTTYSVPKMVISGHGRIFEEYIGDENIYKIYTNKNFSKSDWNTYVQATANFINDLSEYKPVCKKGPQQNIGRFDLKDINDLARLVKAQPNGIKETFIESYKYLCDLPENQEFVFSHSDLHTGNILIKQKEPFQLAFIDFAQAGYLSKLDAMYGFYVTNYKEIWDTANKLGRTANPDLTWNYNPDLEKIYTTLYDAINTITMLSIGFHPIHTKKLYTNQIYRAGLILGVLLDKVQKSNYQQTTRYLPVKTK